MKLFGPFPKRHTTQSTIVNIPTDLKLHTIWITRCEWIRGGTTFTEGPLRTIWTYLLRKISKTLRRSPKLPLHRVALWRTPPSSPILQSLANWLDSATLPSNADQAAPDPTHNGRVNGEEPASTASNDPARPPSG